MSGQGQKNEEFINDNTKHQKIARAFKNLTFNISLTTSYKYRQYVQNINKNKRSVFKETNV